MLYLDEMLRAAFRADAHLDAEGPGCATLQMSSQFVDRVAHGDVMRIATSELHATMIATFGVPPGAPYYVELRVVNGRPPELSQQESN